MPSVIEIENGLVTLVERNITGTMPLENWITKVETRAPITLPVLPNGARAVYWDPTNLSNQKFCVLIEQEPQIIHMNLNGRTRTLSIPWTRFIFTCSTSDASNNLSWVLEDYLIFWSNKQYKDPTALDMIAALMPNVYRDGRICFGSTGADANQTLANRLNQTVNEFYTSNFNNDLDIRRPDGSTGYREWERMSREDPTAWADWDDWDQGTFQQFFKVEDVFTGELGRGEPMITADPIPPAPMGPTFGRVQEWIDSLAGQDRERILRAMLVDQQRTPERYINIPVVTDDTE